MCQGLCWHPQAEVPTVNTQLLSHILVHSPCPSPSPLFKKIFFFASCSTYHIPHTDYQWDRTLSPVPHAWGEPPILPIISLQWQLGLQTFTFHTGSEDLLHSRSLAAPGCACGEKGPRVDYSAGRDSQAWGLWKFQVTRKRPWVPLSCRSSLLL